MIGAHVIGDWLRALLTATGTKIGCVPGLVRSWGSLQGAFEICWLVINLGAVGDDFECCTLWIRVFSVLALRKADKVVLISWLR